MVDLGSPTAKELAAIRERHRYTEGKNSDGDDRVGCICGELWQCDAADLIAHIDSLMAVAILAFPELRAIVERTADELNDELAR